MTPEQFAYWLQGYVENGGEMPDEQTWQSIKDHLATVFQKITPDYSQPTAPLSPPPEKQDNEWRPPYEVIC